jgi:hypothetical protein
LHQLHKHDIAVYVLEDKDENQLRVKNYITFLSIETEMARNSGFSNGNLVHRVVQAWDKALFYFTKVSRSYAFVWFMEYDVYIPSLKAFLDVHNMAMHQRSDFVVREKELVDNTWIPWRVGDDFHMDRPWYHSLVCASGLSRRLLGDVLEYTRTYHQLEMIEVLFHTITDHKKYNLYLPRQFETINFNPQGYVNWDCKDVLTTHSDMWYHPIKDQTKFLNECNRTHNPSTAPSVIPSSSPSEVSSAVPSVGPSFSPTFVPSLNRSDLLSSSPSDIHTTIPTARSSLSPTFVPSVNRSELPSSSPSDIHTTVPTARSSLSPTFVPRVNRSELPSSAPSDIHTTVPTVGPSLSPTFEPRVNRSKLPSAAASAVPK